MADNEFVTPNPPRNVHISYWVEDMAKWLATRDDKDFKYLCTLLTGERYKRMILEDAPQKEEPQDKIELPWGVVGGLGRITRMAESPKEDDPELTLTVGQMKELFDNLLAEGFAKDEAARIVGVVARG